MRGRQQLSSGLEHLFALRLLRTKADPRTGYFFGVRCDSLHDDFVTPFEMNNFQVGRAISFSFFPFHLVWAEMSGFQTQCNKGSCSQFKNVKNTKHRHHDIIGYYI